MIKKGTKKSHDSNWNFSWCRRVQPVFIPSFNGGIFCGFPSACEAMRKGTDKDWEQRAGCMTFPDAVSKVEPTRKGGVSQVHPEKSFRMYVFPYF